MQGQNRWGRDVLGYEPVDQFIRMKREKKQKSGKFVQMAKRWLLAASRNGSITISGWRCYCGKNHYTLRIGEEAVCPIRFILAMTVLADSEEKAKAFLEKCDPRKILRRFDPSKDANHKAELHRKETT